MTQELRAFNGIKMWEIQNRLRERPPVQPVHGSSPSHRAVLGAGMGQSWGSPGPQDTLGQPSDQVLPRMDMGSVGQQGGAA